MLAAVYCRVSTPGQEDGASLDIQERACRDYAAANGHTVLDRHVYREVYSGADLRGRPRLAELRRALAAREVGVVIAYTLDRLSRDQIHIAVLIDDIEAAGAKLDLVLEDWVRTPVGIIIMQVKAFAAALERERIILRTQGGRRARVERGRPLLGSSVPYGFTLNAEHSAYLIDPERADVIRRAFELVAGGATLRDTARALNADSIPSPRGALWRHDNLNRLLHNPAYAGRAVGYRWGGRPDNKRSMKVRPESEWIELPGVAPAIVTPALFEAVAQRLRWNQESAARRTKDPERDMLRGGLAYCGHCGAKLYPSDVVQNRRIYRCGSMSKLNGPCTERPRINANRLDREVWSVLAAHLTERESLMRLGAARQPRANDQPELDRRTRAIATLDAEITTLTRRMRLLPEENVQDAVDLLVELNKRRQDQRAALDQLRAQAGQRDTDAEIARNVDAWLARHGDNLATLPNTVKRELLYALGLRVRLVRVEGGMEWSLARVR